MEIHLIGASIMHKKQFQSQFSTDQSKECNDLNRRFWPKLSSDTSFRRTKAKNAPIWSVTILNSCPNDLKYIADLRVYPLLRLQLTI